MKELLKCNVILTDSMLWEANKRKLNSNGLNSEQNALNPITKQLELD